MNFIKNRFLFEEADDGKGAGGAGEPPPKADEKNDSASQEDGDKFDELGYEKKPSEPPKGEEAPKDGKKADSPAAEEKVKDPATGYGVEPPKEEPPPKEEAPPKEEVKLDYELKLDGLDDKEASIVKEFAKNVGLSKEAAQAFADMRKTEIKDLNDAKAQDKQKIVDAVKAQKSSWDKELRNDPVFGGKNFEHNIMKAEKVLAEFMPETKKALTERKSMLPPYVMRDLAVLAGKMYGTEKFVHGDPPEPNKEEKAVGEFDHLKELYS